MRIAIGPAKLGQPSAIVETRFRRIPEWPSAIVAGQGQSRYHFWALSTWCLDDGFPAKQRRNQVGRGGEFVRIGCHVALIENDGTFRRFDFLVHSDSLFFIDMGPGPMCLRRIRSGLILGA